MSAAYSEDSKKMLSWGLELPTTRICPGTTTNELRLKMGSETVIFKATGMCGDQLASSTQWRRYFQNPNSMWVTYAQKRLGPRDYFDLNTRQWNVVTDQRDVVTFRPLSILVVGQRKSHLTQSIDHLISSLPRAGQQKSHLARDWKEIGGSRSNKEHHLKRNQYGWKIRINSVTLTILVEFGGTRVA